MKTILIPKFSLFTKGDAEAAGLSPCSHVFSLAYTKTLSSDLMQELGEALRPHPDSGIESEELATLGNNYSIFLTKQ